MASNQSKRRRHRRSFGAIRQLGLQLMPTQSTAQGGRPAELWVMNPKAPESFRLLYN